jgi:hypothetical protein
MSTALNDRDAILQAASVRVINPKNASILMSASTSLFHLSAAGDVDVPAITITATLIGLEGDVTFTVDGAALTSVTGKTAVVRYEDMQGPAAIVTASIVAGGQTFAQSCIIGVVRDGAGGSTTYTWVKYADGPSGEGLSDNPTGKSYIGLAYNKGTAVESTAPGVYTWSLIKGTDGQPGGKGADGATLYTWIKYSDSPDGSAPYDTPNAGTAYLGLAVNKPTAVESNTPGDYVWSKFRGADGVSMPGTPGARGAGQYYAGGSAWSDGTANAATPGDNVVSDVVTISNGGTFAMTKRWDGASWNAIGAVFDGSLFATGSINGAAIRAGTLDIRAPDGRLLLGANGDFGGIVRASNLQVGEDQNNLIRDPRFKDLAWWGMDPYTFGGTNVQVTDWNGTTQNAWRHNVSVAFNSTNGVQYNNETKRMPLVPGATYLVEYDLYFNDNWNGDFTVWLNVPNWAGNLLGGLGIVPDSGYPFADGNGIQYPGYTRGWKRVSTVITIPPNIPSATEGSFVFLRSVRGGSVEVGGFNLIRLMDSVLIKDGAVIAGKVGAKAIKADNIDVVNLSAVSAALGDVLLGANGALHQGTNAYNTGTGIYYGAPGGVPKFFAGTAGGANIRWSPEEGLRVDQASLESYAAWLTGSAGGSYPNGSAGYGFLQANVSGGKAPYTYRWTLTVETKTGNAGNMVISSTTSQSASFSGSGTNATLTYTVTCAVTDGNQRTIVLGTSINANHGTPP